MSRPGSACTVELPTAVTGIAESGPGHVGLAAAWSEKRGIVATFNRAEP